MAEPTMELDDLVRDYLERHQEAGAPAGVADAIRGRLASGDPGSTLPGSSAPGYGAGLRTWLPWIGLIVVAGVAGGALGLGGAFGRPVDTVAVAGSTAPLAHAAPVLACPGGPVVDQVDAGTRVLAVQRSENGSELGIRDPGDFSSIVWIAAGDVVVDAGQPAAASLPVGDACPTVTVTVVAPSQAPAPPSAPPSTAPSHKPEPPKPSDTSAPTIGTPTANPTQFGNTEPGVISVSASDNVAVTGVRISWSGQYSGSANMTSSGGVWKYTFTPPDANSGDITFSMYATDAAGNHSATATITVHHYFLG